NGDLFVAFMSDVAPPVVAADPGDELGEAVSGVSKVTSTTFVGAGNVPTGVPLPVGVVASVATFSGNPVRHQRAGSLLAADVDPVSGRAYVVWEDARFRVANATDAANDAVLSYSDDGLTWSAPVRLNRGPTGDNVDHYNPSVAVHKDGTVDVIWRQRTESASADVTTYSKDIDTYFARSHDHGLTFGTPLKVDLAPSDTRFGAFSRGGLFQGDYDQVATAGDLTYVVRSESYAPSGSVQAPVAPSATTTHHQTTWVAVIGTAKAGSTVVPPSRTPVKTPTPTAVSSGLPATGGSYVLALLALTALGMSLVLRRGRTG
ncbi:MAG: BNR/Asp-box repeat protein, partial [Frankiales bacterium]|nr:BNR/Asp-box repeat protein [Frankiales bacterium]